jgi:hypothetical protein
LWLLDQPDAPAATADRSASAVEAHLRQRSGDDETAVIGELSEAIVSIDAFADIPVLMAKALAGGISL